MEQLGDTAVVADRARWVAELTESVEKAQLLAWALGVSPGTSSEARQLYDRLEAIKIELRSLRLGWTTQETEFDPEWVKCLQWSGHSRVD